MMINSTDVVEDWESLESLLSVQQKRDTDAVCCDTPNRDENNETNYSTISTLESASASASSVVVTPPTTTTTTKHEYASIISTATTSNVSTTSPWEDASYTLGATTTTTATKTATTRPSSSSASLSITNPEQYRPQRTQQIPYFFGRFSTNNTTQGSSSNNNNSNSNQVRGSDTDDNNTHNTTTTFWWTQREYNLSNALRYTERMTIQLRYMILYILSIWDCIYAILITIYISRILLLYHHDSNHHHHHHQQQYYSNNTIITVVNDDDTGVATTTRTNSNYQITTILMTFLIIQILFLYIRCIIIFITTKTLFNDYDYYDYYFYCQYWISRCISIGLIFGYLIFSITVLVTWNIMHLKGLEQFLLFSPQNNDDDNNIPIPTKYNLQSYWLFHSSWIHYIHDHHCMNYLYAFLLLFSFIEMIRYIILQSYYYTTILFQNQNDHHGRRDDEAYDNNVSSMEEALLPLRLWYENDNLPSTTTTATTTTTSWRTTTLNQNYFQYPWLRPTTTSSVAANHHASSTNNNNRRHDQTIDPIQLQTIQEEWNHRKEIHGPYWWSQE